MKVVTRVQGAGVEGAVNFPMSLVTARFRDRVDLSRQVASILRRRQRCDDRVFSDRFDRLRNESEIPLAADSDVLIIVVRAVNREIVPARAESVDRELPG